MFFFFFFFFFFLFLGHKLPKCGYSELKFPRFESTRTRTLAKNLQEPSVSRNDFPSKGVPLFQWSWPRNVRRRGWKRPQARLPPLSVTTDKTEPVNIGYSDSVLECDTKAGSLRSESIRYIPSNIISGESRGKIKSKINKKIANPDIVEPEVKNNLPEIKRKELVVFIPYIQYDSNIEESEESVDEEGDDTFKINENNLCHQKKSKNKRLVQGRNKNSDKTICNKQSQVLRQSSKSSIATENRMSAQRMRVLARKAIAATEAKDEQRCYSSEEESSDGQDKNNEKSIVDFSHKVRVQWQKELREILNKSSDYKRDRDKTSVDEKPDFWPCKVTAVSPPNATNDNVFSLPDNHGKKDDKLESAKRNCNHLQRLGVRYNSGLTSKVPLGPESTTFRRRKKNPNTKLEVRIKRSTRKSHHLSGHGESSQSDSFDFNFFWNLLEMSKSQAGGGVKLSPNDSRKNSYSSNPESWAINSPVYKQIFFYKKKLK